MKKQFLVVGLLVLAGNNAVLFGQGLADAAEQDLHLVKETHYQHKTHIDKAAGVFDLDCSGFVDHLVKQVAPQQYDRFPIELRHTRPRAEVYYQFFVDLAETPKPGWRAVSRFAELRRGDLIAWKKETTAGNRRYGPRDGSWSSAGTVRQRCVSIDRLRFD
jgi:hypothetical protein